MSRRVVKGYKVLESVMVEIDAALEKFAGVLIELVIDGERYVLTEMVLVTVTAYCASAQLTGA